MAEQRKPWRETNILRRYAPDMPYDEWLLEVLTKGKLGKGCTLLDAFRVIEELEERGRREMVRSVRLSVPDREDNTFLYTKVVEVEREGE